MIESRFPVGIKAKEVKQGALGVHHMTIAAALLVVVLMKRRT